jgi:roadblock/LC7 domain-containing protein
MSDLNKLMAVEGAVGAFKFTSKGELAESKITDGSGLNEQILDLLCHVCVANMSIATMQARGWENMTGMKGFYPIKGFTMVGFEWTVIANEEFGVVVPNSQVDYEAAHVALAG